MKQAEIRELLYNKYILPTKENRKGYIGVEIEMPIVNLNKQAVDFDVVHKITYKFIEQFGFDRVDKDDEGNIYVATHSVCGDILSYDCSYNNLELSFGKESELFTLQKRFIDYCSFLQDEFKKYNYTLTGMGVNPYRGYNRNVPIPNGRYRMLFHHLNSYKNYDIPMYFHEYPEYGTFSSASQVQLDVSYDNLPLTLNAFSKLEPIKALIFSNSVLLDEHEDLLCCRDMFWEYSTHGINPKNIGMYGYEFNSADEVLSYIESTSIYCTEREGKYINFAPVNIMDYFNMPSFEGEYYDNGEYKKIKIKPETSDIKYLRTFKFEDLTYRGTVEFRSVCCQPLKDAMTVAAFHVGLMDNVSRLDKILSDDSVIYHHGYTATELRKMFVKDKLPQFIDEDRLYALAKEILDLAKEGLENRGFGEESLLCPLYDRVEKRTNPAKIMLEDKNRGTDLQDIILAYGKLG